MKRGFRRFIVIVGLMLVIIQTRSSSQFYKQIDDDRLSSSSKSPSREYSQVLKAPRTPSGNRTLVIVLGNLRCGEEAWATLYRHVLDVNSADLALMIGDTYPEYEHSTMFERARYIWKFQEYDDWADAIDLINGPAWRTELLPHMGDEGLLGGVKGKRSTGGLLMMVRWFLRKRIEQDGILDLYDRFVVTRSDHYYLCDHDLAPLDHNFMWIPLGEWYGGYTDRHLVVSSEHLIDATEILSPMIENPASFTRSKLTMNDNIEQFQTRIWHRRGILDKVRQFKRMMFVCAAPTDKTRWKEMTKQTVEGSDLHIKYYGEYAKSKRFCDRETTVEDLLERAEEVPRLKIRPVLANANSKSD